MKGSGIIGAVVILGVLLGMIVWLGAELFDWHPFADHSGPEYVNYKIIYITIPKQKPWFEWLK